MMEIEGEHCNHRIHSNSKRITAVGCLVNPIEATINFVLYKNINNKIWKKIIKWFQYFIKEIQFKIFLFLILCVFLRYVYRNIKNKYLLVYWIFPRFLNIHSKNHWSNLKGEGFEEETLSYLLRHRD